MILAERKLLITGVITRGSIAFEVARRAQLAGAEILLTGFGRAKRMTERAAKGLPTPVDVLELDVNRPEDLDALGAALEERWDHLDGILHAIAFAPEDGLGGAFLSTPPASAVTAFETSAFSLKALTVAVLPLLERAPDGASVVGLDFDAGVAWPAYDWMGVAKAALESVSRYLARDLGPRGHPLEPHLGRPDRDAGRRGHPRLRAPRRALAEPGPTRLGGQGRRPGGRRLLLPALPARTGASPARSSTSTVASTPWAPRCDERPAHRGDRLPRDGGPRPPARPVGHRDRRARAGPRSRGGRPAHRHRPRPALREPGGPGRRADPRPARRRQLA